MTSNTLSSGALSAGILSVPGEIELRCPFSGESAFEAHVRTLLEVDVAPRVPGLKILGAKKGVDIFLFKDCPIPAIYFIEVKYFNLGKNHSMVSLGTGDGAGFQAATLLQRPAYLEKNLRWVLGTADNDNYYFLSTAEALTHVSGGSVGPKQNGFRRSVFSKVAGLPKGAFVEELVRWLQTT